MFWSSGSGGGTADTGGVVGSGGALQKPSCRTGEIAQIIVITTIPV